MWYHLLSSNTEGCNDQSPSHQQNASSADYHHQRLLPEGSWSSQASASNGFSSATRNSPQEPLRKSLSTQSSFNYMVITVLVSASLVPLNSRSLTDPPPRDPIAQVLQYDCWLIGMVIKVQLLGPVWVHSWVQKCHWVQPLVSSKSTGSTFGPNNRVHHCVQNQKVA